MGKRQRYLGSLALTAGLLAGCGDSTNKGAADMAVAVAPDDLAGLDLSGVDQLAVADDLPNVDALIAASAPFLVSSIPTNGAAAVRVNTTLALQFSKPMQTASVTATFTPSVTLGAGVWTSGDTVVTFTPSAPLATGSTYMIAVAGSSKDNLTLAAITLQLKTAPPPDTTPPTIVSTTPANGASNFDRMMPMSVKFSETMDTSQLTLTVTPIGYLAAPPAVTWSEGNTRLTVNNPPYLNSGASYTVTVAAKDGAGNALSGTASFSFTTSDTIPPRLIAFYPKGNDAVSSVTTKPSMSFSEPMDKTSVENAFTVTNEGTDGLGTAAVTCGSFTWTNNDQQVTCNYTTPLANGTYFLAKLGTGAKDKAGNAISFNCVPSAARPGHPVAIQCCGAHPECVGMPATCNYPVCVQTFYSWEYLTVASAPPPPDTTPPTVMTGIPTGTDHSIHPDESTITVTFSEPMNIQSVQAAFSTTPACSSPPCGLFFWTPDNTTFDYVPFANWPYATGAADNITYTIGTGAQDPAGNGLASPYSGSFRTLFSRTVTLHPEVVPFGGSGWVYSGTTSNGQVNWSADGNSHDHINAGSWGFFNAGGALFSSMSACESITDIRGGRGFVIFFLNLKGMSAPPIITSITYAKLTMSTDSVAISSGAGNGTNLSVLGKLNVESVWNPPNMNGVQGALVPDSYTMAAIAADGTAALQPADGTVGDQTANVTPMVVGALARAATQNNYMQLRLRWDTETIDYSCHGGNNYGYLFDAMNSSLAVTFETTTPP